MLCQGIPKQDAILSGRREGVAGHLPLEWVAPYVIGAQGKAFPYQVDAVLVSSHVRYRYHVAENFGDQSPEGLIPVVDSDFSELSSSESEYSRHREPPIESNEIVF